MLSRMVGDPIEMLRMVLHVDVGSVSDLRIAKSASGACVALVGPQAFFPIDSLCKKQGCVSHSSTEVVIISLGHVVRQEALPLIALWDVICYMVKRRKCSVRGSGV